MNISLVNDWNSNYFQDISPSGCADKCFEQLGNNCTSFFFMKEYNICTSLVGVFSILRSPAQCYFYIIDKTATTPDRPDLNITEKLVYAAAYANPTDLCPIAFTYNGTYCMNKVPVCHFELIKI